MSKKSTKALASAALMSLVLTTALSAGPVKAAAGQVTRTSGTTRYATAAQVATTNWTSGSDNVVLVSGEGYADAVSASALAKKLNAPILLTTPDTLSADAQTALTTLKPKNIYVIGGTASISQSIRDGLKANYTLTELGGANRYETNAAVADELVKLGVDPSNVMVVGGQGFSDALSVAPVAAAKGQILLLASNDQASTQPVIDFIKANNSKATVVGTSNVINDTIYNALGATTRVDGGTSRFDTNLKVLAAFKDSLKTDKLYIANASAADPDNLYADALVASAVAGKYSAPLVLVDKDPSGSTTTPNATDNAIAYIKANSTSSSDLQLVGGTAVVSQATQDAVNKIYNPGGNTDQGSEVQSIESVGLNQIKVTFNGEVDSDTAEDVTNYKVDGTALNDNGTGTADSAGAVTVANDNSAKAVLQDDNKTVLITLAKTEKQSGNVDVTVKKGILSADKSQTVPEFTQNVTFSDTTAPTLTSVEAKGNNKLTVKFSEPINFGNIGLTSIDSGKSYIANAYNSPTLSKFKINDQNITSFGLDGSGLSQVKNFVKDNAGNVWSNEIDLYFNSSLQPGNNTLKVSDGDNGLLYDSASFPFQETTQDFNVDTLTTTPQVNSITASDDGKIYINFDRPMDANTAVNKSYYVLNSTNDSDTLANKTGVKVELKQGDTQVKISGVSSYIKNGSNTIYIKNSVKDAYGNKVADDTRESFTLTEDTTKPAVSSVTTLDDSTIRVRFNKDVSVPYATNTSNYELQDNSGTDITNDTTKGIKDITVPGGSTTSASVFDINTYGKLTEANYTITIKNIIDTASNPNTMDDYVQTFAGSTTVAPTVTNAYKVVNSNDTEANRKVVVYFSTAMDSSSITDTSNYKFINGSTDTKALPSGTTISASSDNKSATIEFPSSYGTDKSGDNLIKGIAVLGVKDQNGNTLEVNYQTQINNQTSTTDLPLNTSKDKIDANSIKFVYDGDNLKVQFKFTQPIDTFDYSDFTVNGVKPTSGYPSGDVMTLQFNDGDNATSPEAIASGFLGTTNGFGTGTIAKNITYSPSKIEAVKFAGKYATIGIVSSPKTVDVFGTPIATTTGTIGDGTDGNYSSADAAKLVAYNYNAAPKTVADEWYGTLNSDNSGAGYVDVTFDTPVDQYSGIKTDDFVFSVGGKVLKADNIKINPDTTPDKIASASANTVRFLFNATTLQDSTTGKNYFTTDGANTINTTTPNGAKINVYAKSTASIRTLKDGSGNYANYVPSTDDTTVRYITIGATTGAQKN